VAVPFATAAGRRDLAALLRAADVVVEASRPRALAQLGLSPTDLGADGPAVWVSITAHGRRGELADRVGFGDDAAAAGGLVAWTADGPVFAGDAIADPLTGVAAAAAVSDALGDATERPGGRRWLVDVALAEVAAWVAGDDGGTGPENATPWTEVDDPPAPPALAPPPTRAAPLGADTAAVLAEIRGTARRPRR
jgi:crotonobetainyl-CoA:carnitine CoA-transferase CaiB-like acyl-CoA transferase